MMMIIIIIIIINCWRTIEEKKNEKEKDILLLFDKCLMDQHQQSQNDFSLFHVDRSNMISCRSSNVESCVCLYDLFVRNPGWSWFCFISLIMY